MKKIFNFLTICAVACGMLSCGDSKENGNCNCEKDQVCIKGACYEPDDSCEDCEGSEVCIKGLCVEVDTSGDDEPGDDVCSLYDLQRKTCKNHADCRGCGVCVKTLCGSETLSEGICIPEEQVSHCVDNDRDGFFSVTDIEFVAECGFSESIPEDPDDCDPLVFPGAAEICDGKDNSGDGCVDGVCPDGQNCHDNRDLCVILSHPCIGGGSVDLYKNSVCSAEKIGAIVCVDGAEQYAISDDSGIYTLAMGACPNSFDEVPGYVENEDGDEVKCDGIDNNCNGQVDEHCKK